MNTQSIIEYLNTIGSAFQDVWDYFEETNTNIENIEFWLYVTLISVIITFTTIIISNLSLKKEIRNLKKTILEIKNEELKHKSKEEQKLNKNGDEEE